MKYGELSFGQTEALMSKIGGMDGLLKLLSGEWIVGEPADVRSIAKAPSKIIDDLLELSEEEIEVSADERFIARSKFVLDRNGELPISYIGEDFAENFLDLIEEGLKAVKLKQYKLIKGSIDRPIFAALCGENKARVALAHVFEFLKVADRSRWFFFYVADVKGMLWAIDTYWRDNGWDIECYSVTYPRGWRGGGRIVSTGCANDGHVHE